MGELWRYFRDILHWGPIQKPGPLQALAHGTARSMDQTREDMLYLRDQWLPARCEESMVPEHGESRGIIRHVGRQVTETPEQYRARVVHAYAWHMLGGKVAGLPEILKFYGFDVTIENMRPFAPTRWAEFMVRLEAPPSYVDQFRQIEDLPELVWLLNEYKPARSFFFRVYNATYDRRPLVLGIGPKLGSGWLSLWSGVPIGGVGEQNKDSLVSLGVRCAFHGEAPYRRRAWAGLHNGMGARGESPLRRGFILGRSRLSQTFPRYGGYVFSQLFSLQGGEPVLDDRTWDDGAWDDRRWEEIVGWTRSVAPGVAGMTSFAKSQLVLGRSRLSGINAKLGGVRVFHWLENLPRLGSFRLGVNGPRRRAEPMHEFSARQARLPAAPARVPSGLGIGSSVLGVHGAGPFDDGWTGAWDDRRWGGYPIYAGLACTAGLSTEAAAVPDAGAWGASVASAGAAPVASDPGRAHGASLLSLGGAPLHNENWTGEWDDRRWNEYAGFAKLTTITR